MSKSTSGDFFQVTDNSMDGLYTWAGLAVLATLFGGLLYEILRRQKVMHRIMYTRSHTNATSTPDFPVGLFGWVSLAYRTDEVYILIDYIKIKSWMSEHAGLDAVMFLRFLHLGFRFCMFALVFVFPILTVIRIIIK